MVYKQTWNILFCWYGWCMPVSYICARRCCRICVVWFIYSFLSTQIKTSISETNYKCFKYCTVFCLYLIIWFFDNNPQSYKVSILLLNVFQARKQILYLLTCISSGYHFCRARLRWARLSRHFWPLGRFMCVRPSVRPYVRASVRICPAYISLILWRI